MTTPNQLPIYAQECFPEALVHSQDHQLHSNPNAAPASAISSNYIYQDPQHYNHFQQIQQIQSPLQSYHEHFLFLNRNGHIDMFYEPFLQLQQLKLQHQHQHLHFPLLQQHQQHQQQHPQQQQNQQQQIPSAGYPIHIKQQSQNVNQQLSANISLQKVAKHSRSRLSPNKTIINKQPLEHQELVKPEPKKETVFPTPDNSHSENSRRSSIALQNKPRIRTTFWEDEKTLCYQVEVNGILVSRREDTNYVNGTKLLNVTGMSRGKRDGVLKAEKKKYVVRVGAMKLKGVWIPFERAAEIARNEGIDTLLYPLLVSNLKQYYDEKGSKLKNWDSSKLSLDVKKSMDV